VAGGETADGITLASAELYDTSSATWSATANLAIDRESHTATLLRDGRLLVVGGFQGNGAGALADAELYDPVSASWTATGGLRIARYFHTATLLPDGKVLVAGGLDSASSEIASAELYDPATGVWVDAGEMISKRQMGSVTLLPNGQVLVAGGFNTTDGYLASAELYDPTNETWTATDNLVSAVAGHTAILLPGGAVLVAGGINSNGVSGRAELYDPASETWSATASLITARNGHTTTLLGNGRILLTGGRDSNFRPLANTELFDVGLEARSEWKPKIDQASSTFEHGWRVRLGGTRFQGISEGSRGDVADSATNYPIVQLRRLDSSQVAFLPVDPRRGWSNTSFRCAPLSDFPSGPTLVTVFTNGVQSNATYLLLSASNQ
jgi:N-acetylneuraminic acid mutarotase